MRKITTLLLLLIFMIVNSGMAISIHWCGGQVSSVDFYESEIHSCKCGKRPMQANCCKDESIVFKATDEFSKTSSLSISKSSLIKLLFSNSQKNKFEFFENYDICFSFFYDQPPFKLKHPIFLLDQVFLI